MFQILTHLVFEFPAVHWHELDLCFPQQASKHPHSVLFLLFHWCPHHSSNFYIFSIDSCWIVMLCCFPRSMLMVSSQPVKPHPPPFFNFSFSLICLPLCKHLQDNWTLWSLPNLLMMIFIPTLWFFISLPTTKITNVFMFLSCSSTLFILCLRHGFWKLLWNLSPFRY